MTEIRILVEIDAEGRIKAEAEGFSGDTCLKELAKLLDGLGDWENVERKEQTEVQPSTTARSRPMLRAKKS
jgi:hypothetical protein